MDKVLSESYFYFKTPIQIQTSQGAFQVEASEGIQIGTETDFISLDQVMSLKGLKITLFRLKGKVIVSNISDESSTSLIITA